MLRACEDAVDARAGKWRGVAWRGVMSCHAHDTGISLYRAVDQCRRRKLQFTSSTASIGQCHPLV